MKPDEYRLECQPTIAVKFNIKAGNSTQHFNILLYTAVPSGPPENLRISTGARSLSLTWNPPLVASRNGLIIDYTIECSGQAAIVTAQTMFTITGLTPFTEYTCSVFASNSAGDGPSAVEVATTQTASM